MESANRGLIIRTGSTSQRSARLLSVASDRPTVPSRVIFLRASSSQVFMPATVQYALRYDGRDRPVRSPRGSRDGMQASFSGSGEDFPLRGREKKLPIGASASAYH